MYWIHLHSTFGYKRQVVKTFYNVLDPPSQYLRLQEASGQYDLSMYWIHLHSTFGYKRQVVKTFYNVLDPPSQYLRLQEASGQYDLSMYWIHLHSTFGYKRQVVKTFYNVLDPPSQYLRLQEASDQYVLQCIGSTFTVPSTTRCKWSIRSTMYWIHLHSTFGYTLHLIRLLQKINSHSKSVPGGHISTLNANPPLTLTPQ